MLQKTAKDENMTVVIITHNSALAPMADKVIKFKSGTVSDVIINKKPTPVSELEW